MLSEGVGQRIVVALALTTMACQSWVPVARSNLRTELEKRDGFGGASSDVLVVTEGKRFIVSRASACDLGDVIVVSGESSRAARTFGEQHPVDSARLAEHECLCPHAPPCTRLDVSHADVSLRKSNTSAIAIGAIAITLGAVALVALFVGLWAANGCLVCLR